MLKNWNIQFVGIPWVWKSIIIDGVDNKLISYWYETKKFEFWKELKEVLLDDWIKLWDWTIPDKKYIDVVIEKCIKLSNEKLILMSGHLVHYNSLTNSYKIKTDIDELLKPVAYVYIRSDAEQILHRRVKDNDRQREIWTESTINLHQEKTLEVVKQLAKTLGSKYLEINNVEWHVEKSIYEIIDFLEKI